MGLGVPVWFTSERVCIAVLALVVVGMFSMNPTVFEDWQFPAWPNYTSDTGDDNTTTTTTTTTVNDTEDTEDRYTVRVKWDYVPIMQIDGPAWLDMQIYTHPDDIFVDAASMVAENTWYNTINREVQNFALGDYVLIYIVDGDGWNFNFVEDAHTHTKYLLEVGTDLTADLYPTDTDQDWGNFWLEWVKL